MAESTTKKTTAKKTTAKKTARRSSSAFTAEERAAMKETARERRRAAAGADGEKDLLTKVAEMPPADREIAEGLHALIKATAPHLTCRTWYGMPAYVKDGDVLCFFQSAAKFKSRYATLGFTDKAALDGGAMWPTYFAVAEWNAGVEKQIGKLISQAVG
jgi:uncharacterized protein YdhG (YjbR/CyaY superfamily)